MMELIKADITKVISKYMRIDTDHMEIEIQAKGGLRKYRKYIREKGRINV